MKHIISFTISLFIFTALATAQFQVGTQSLSVQDPSRSNRNIGYEVCYPATTAGTNAPVAAGQFPVIVFGHGFGIAISEYDVWCNAYASKGYIIAFPTTEGSVFPFPNHEQFSLDMSFLIDHLLGAGTPFSGSILGTSAIMGHSMGGGASWAAAASNPNITTMVTLAAAETNAPVSSIGAAPNITIPTFTLAGTSDCVVMNGGAPIDMYNALPASPYHVYLDIIGGSHCQFGEASSFSICTTGEFCSGFIPKADQHTQMLTSTCLWMDYYLKDDCQAFLDLQTYIDTNEAGLHNSMEMGTEPVTSCNACASMGLSFTFDDNPQQTSWEILDANGVSVASGGTYNMGDVSATEDVCLPDGCYDLIVSDSANDGMCPRRTTTVLTGINIATLGLGGVFNGIPRSGMMCGNYTLTDASGNIVATGGGRFGSSESNSFCIVGGVPQLVINNDETYTKQITNIDTPEMTLMPNPAQDQLNIYYNLPSNTDLQLNILDVTGKIIHQYKRGADDLSSIQLDISELNSGFYFVQLKSENTLISRKFAKQ